MHGWDELLALRVVRRLIDIAAGRWGAAINFVDAAGQPVPGAAKAPEVCAAARTTAADRQACRDAPGVLMEWLRTRSDGGEEAPSIVEWRCHAGRTLVAAPLVADGELWGAVYVAEPPGLPAEARDYLREIVGLVAGEIHGYRIELARRERRLEMGGDLERFEALVGRSPAMNALYRMVEKVASSDTTVLVTGENGTGKELIARAIHDRGPRRSGPFLAQSCSAFNENLLESELFGHVRGAFTGAVAEKKGLFEVAHGGTFFLDEIAETSPALQVKLLRVLQEGVVLPVGATRPVEIDVRIVAATNRDLAALVEAGSFREDLFYRVHVIELSVPPLRERLEDLPMLVEHFLARHVRPGRPVKRLTARALERLAGYGWPGNVRELENEIERLVVMAGEDPVIDEPLLSDAIRSAGGRRIRAAGPTGSLPRAVVSLEKRMIAEALRRHQGNRTHAARALGVSRRNLIRKIRDHGLG